MGDAYERAVRERYFRKKKNRAFLERKEPERGESFHRRSFDREVDGGFLWLFSLREN